MSQECIGSWASHKPVDPNRWQPLNPPDRDGPGAPKAWRAAALQHLAPGAEQRSAGCELAAERNQVLLAAPGVVEEQQGPASRPVGGRLEPVNEIGGGFHRPRFKQRLAP